MSRHIRPLGTFGPLYWGFMIGSVVQLFGGNGVPTGLVIWLVLTVIQMIVNLVSCLAPD